MHRQMNRQGGRNTGREEEAKYLNNIRTLEVDRGK